VLHLQIVICDIKTELLIAYRNASDAYSRAVSELAHGLGIVWRDEYNTLNLAAEKARLTATEARNTYDVHVQEHGCDSATI